MPFLNVDIFRDMPKDLTGGNNHYLQKLGQSRADSNLPIVFGSQLKNKKGNWRSLFSNEMKLFPEKLVLEIGVHKGKILKELVEKKPSWAFLGMDVTLKRVVMSASKVETTGAKNSKVILGDAKYLSKIISDEELDGVIIFFPDPWNKKERQVNKRLLNRDFCFNLFKTIKVGGFIWFKSDCEDYYNSTLGHFNELCMQNTTDRPVDFVLESTYERKFRLQSLPIHEAVLIKS